MSAIGFDRHDHSVCIAQAMRTAEGICETKQLQFTAIRQRVLQILLAEHKAMGAYDILARLNKSAGHSAPPVVYRALEFLVSNGFAHKIEKRNAYIACALPGEAHSPAFMICRNCECVLETQTTPSSGFEKGLAKETGFRIETTVLEAVGLCSNCQQDDPNNAID